MSAAVRWWPQDVAEIALGERGDVRIDPLVRFRPQLGLRVAREEQEEPATPFQSPLRGERLGLGGVALVALWATVRALFLGTLG